MAKQRLWLVIKPDGTLHKPPRVYDTYDKAVRKCIQAGDAVTEVWVDYNREPVFIRRKKLSGGLL